MVPGESLPCQGVPQFSQLDLEDSSLCSRRQDSENRALSGSFRVTCVPKVGNSSGSAHRLLAEGLLHFTHVA